MSENEEFTIDEAELTLVAQQRELNKLMKVILWVLVVLFVITVVIAIRGIQLSDTVNDLEQKTDDLSLQVKTAEENLQTANTQVEALLGSSPEALRDALFSIFRIEQELCGGPCGDPNN